MIKTHIPARPRNKKIVPTGGSSISPSISSAVGSSHTHNNKSLLDLINQGNIDVLSKLFIDAEGNLYTTENFYSQQGVSAYGLGSGGSGGGGDISKLPSWAEYTPAMVDYYVSAGLLVPFRNDTLNRLTSLESGSDTSIVTTGSGNAITSLTKSGSVITANKELTFALASHTHTIAQITGLQGALDLKATQSDIDTAIDGIEIGGRNLVKDSGVEITGTGRLRGYTLSEPLIYGETYTATFKAKKGEGSKFRLWLNNSSTNSGLDLEGNDPNEIIIKSHTFTFTGSETNANLVSIFSEFSSNPSTIYWLQIEKGTIATDWTPAPEDVDASIALVQTNLNTHTLNTSNPHSVTKAQVGLGSVDNTADSAKNVLSATKLTTARTIWGQSFNGEGNVSGALTNVSGITGTTNALGINPAGEAGGMVMDGSVNAIRPYTSQAGIENLGRSDIRWGTVYAVNGNFTGNVTAPTITASTSVTTPKVIFAAAGWSLEQVGTELQMKHNGTAKMRFLSGGSIVATQEITAYS